jgi:ribosome assembly protein RRB1
MCAFSAAAALGPFQCLLVAHLPQPLVAHLLSLQVWRPGLDPVGEDEELDYDPTAYDCLHRFNLEWPCLSFDMLRDDLGAPRAAFPHTVFMVAGTQAAQARQNHIAVLKLAALGQGRHGKRDGKRRRGGGDDDESSSDESSSGSEGGSDSEMDASDDEDDREPPARMHYRWAGCGVGKGVLRRDRSLKCCVQAEA